VTENVILRDLDVHDEVQAVRAVAEMEPEQFEFLPGWSDRRGRWSDYVTWLGKAKRGDELPAGWPRFSLLVGEIDGTIIGRVSLRHTLVPAIATLGGHIGYGVRPAYRGRGFAAQMLKQTLPIARDLGLRELLLTCDDDNRASASVIERCGGVLIERLPANEVRSAKRRYQLFLDA
jgi:predicted acetyltransferase